MGTVNLNPPPSLDFSPTSLPPERPKLHNPSAPNAADQAKIAEFNTKQDAWVAQQKAEHAKRQAAGKNVTLPPVKGGHEAAKAVMAQVVTYYPDYKYDRSSVTMNYDQIASALSQVPSGKGYEGEVAKALRAHKPPISLSTVISAAGMSDRKLATDLSDRYGSAMTKNERLDVVRGFAGTTNQVDDLWIAGIMLNAPHDELKGLAAAAAARGVDLASVTKNLSKLQDRLDKFRDDPQIGAALLLADTKWSVDGALAAANAVKPNSVSWEMKGYILLIAAQHTKMTDKNSNLYSSPDGERQTAALAMGDDPYKAFAKLTQDDAPAGAYKAFVRIAAHDGLFARRLMEYAEKNGDAATVAACKTILKGAYEENPKIIDEWARWHDPKWSGDGEAVSKARQDMFREIAPKWLEKYLAKK